MKTECGMFRSWRGYWATVGAGALLCALLALLLGCSTDATAPSGLHPQFQKVYNGGDGSGGGGGGASGGRMVCEYPKHWSAECEHKQNVAQGSLTGLVPCFGGLNWPCVVGSYTSGQAWRDYHDTPGADGIPYDTDPATNPNTGYPACQFACMTQNDPPFNTIPGGGYLGGY